MHYVTDRDVFVTAHVSAALRIEADGVISLEIAGRPVRRSGLLQAASAYWEDEAARNR